MNRSKRFLMACGFAAMSAGLVRAEGTDPVTTGLSALNSAVGGYATTQGTINGVLFGIAVAAALLVVGIAIVKRFRA